MFVYRVLSLIIFALYSVGMFFYCRGLPSQEISQSVCGFVGLSAFCFSFIWFADLWGSFVGGRATSTSPAWAVAFMGLVLYIVYGIAFVYMYYNNP